MDSLKTSFLVKSILNRCSQGQEELLGICKAKDKEYLNCYKFYSHEDLLAAHGIAKPTNGSTMRVLAIAHTDCVPKYVKPIYDKDKFRIVSGQLDDRLGVAILLDILPNFMPWLQVDVLLTDDEEIGKSTAHDWVLDLQLNNQLEAVKDTYDWIFSFDRAGTDVVTYNFNNKTADDTLETAGWHIGDGSFSDICMVESLGIWACNFGCGYYGQHSNKCYVDLDVLRANLYRFRCFVNKIEPIVASSGQIKNVPYQNSKWGKYGYDPYLPYAQSGKSKAGSFYDDDKYSYLDDDWYRVNKDIPVHLDDFKDDSLIQDVYESLIEEVSVPSFPGDNAEDTITVKDGACFDDTTNFLSGVELEAANQFDNVINQEICDYVDSFIVEYFSSVSNSTQPVWLEPLVSHGSVSIDQFLDLLLINLDYPRVDDIEHFLRYMGEELLRYEIDGRPDLNLLRYFYAKFLDGLLSHVSSPTIGELNNTLSSFRVVVGFPDDLKLSNFKSNDLIIDDNLKMPVDVFIGIVQFCLGEFSSF
jgi:hypothetical protein